MGLYFLGVLRMVLTRGKYGGARLLRAPILRDIRRACFGVAKLVRVHPRAESKTHLFHTRKIPIFRCFRP